MPLYEYECDACGNRFELIRKFSDEPLDRCPKCGGSVRKLQSAPAFQFKGSGFYITDYPKKDQPGGRDESGAQGSSETKDGGAKGDKKDSGGEKKDSGSEKKDSGSEKAAAGAKTEKSSQKSSSSATSDSGSSGPTTKGA